MGPPRKPQNPASSSATLTVLIFVSLVKGLLSQKEDKLMVPASISVQRGLCVHIPCSFASSRNSSEKLHGYWFEKRGRYWHYLVTSYRFQRVEGILVASSDNKMVLHNSVRNRFRLTGDVTAGDCSFSILTVELQDAGEYYFRIETKGMVHDYKGTARMPLKVVVTELTEKPQIRNYSPVVSGTKAVYTCLARGPCLRINAKISWTTILVDYRTVQWRQQQSNGTWIYGSNFTFTPSTIDRGKWLTCWVWYPNVKKRIQSTIFLELTGSPDFDKTPLNVTRDRQLAPRTQFLGTTVTIFVIMQYLLKVLTGILFFIACFVFFARGRFRREGNSR
ncbi:sialic acid-binding Ig-like lectin 8 [Heteronotia binoei]|uniref:sialic acid-binding Ig-like lectin 8 n=1 Tax=Heteronotia binoei TaxID=13085 RepID=UPI00292F8ADF|nr:sialic acid-binding Ig-like lectin 8 [Heteronotia binoei]